MRREPGQPEPHQPRTRFPEAAAAAEDLEQELRHKLRGEVRFDRGSRALYASDLSIYRQPPIGVVVPRDLDDVEFTVDACHRRGVPILGRGTGTSLSGQCCNVAVVIDFSKHLNRILGVDPDGRRAIVQPGVICDQLKDAVNPYGLCFAPDPATHAYCTLGGMIGNNSCGVHSVMGGRTADNVAELEILTYDGLRLRVGATSEAELDEIIRRGGRRGQIYARLRSLRDRYAELIRLRFPKLPRRVSGYNLDELLPERGFHVARALVGSESTCALVLSATLELMHNPPQRALLVIGYPDPFVAADHVPELRNVGPIGLEAFHEHVIENMTAKGQRPSGAALLPDGNTWLLVEFGGETQAEAHEKAERAWQLLDGERRRHAKILDDGGEQQQIWHIRESGVGASRVPEKEDAWPSWEDSAVAPERLGAYLRALDALIKRHGYAYTLFGHFGDGCIHSRICFRLKTTEGVKDFRRFMEEAADLVVAHGGSLSGEHGDGQAKGELLERMFGPELVQAFREFKAIWDPDGRMNPGKIVDAHPLDSNLRVGPGRHVLPVVTHFQFPEDHGSFAHATERCFGIGKCRRLDGGTMCPSFKVTREERHTTRGRARLLFEMLSGEVIDDGWRSDEVKEALDLCLACKGCKGDCPVSVDVATYKAEFLAHYYAHRLRPRSAWALGLVDVWARLGAKVPRLVNFALDEPALARVLKLVGGVAPGRALPPLAGQTFRQWFRKRGPAQGQRAVMLWPDTFNNYFHPSVARAAVEVLEWAGYRVLLPREPVCCGRPLYDYGMLDRAKRQLRRTLRTLRPQLEAGIPVVGLEPSCLAVFRDELPNLMPRDPLARRLADQSVLLSELLDRDGVHLPSLRRRAIVHGHCHHKAVLGFASEERVLRRLGLELDAPDMGCCGMAGSFGYEREHYDLSLQIGEQELLPRVRATATDALVIADGFSCRAQVEGATARRPLHLAEVVHMAIHHGPDGPIGARPERVYGDQHPRMSRREAFAWAACAALAAWWIVRRATR